MSTVGFEPTRISTAVLKTAPLDHSGMSTMWMDHIMYTFIFFKYQRIDSIYYI